MASTGLGVVAWTHRRIPFEFEPGYPHEKIVLAAMAKLEQAGGLWFSRRVTESTYLRISLPDGTSHSVCGMETTPGVKDCKINGFVQALHELGHAIGLIHEQSRGDRETYIVVNDPVILAERKHDFGLDRDSSPLGEYDPTSIMHYPAPAKGWGADPSVESWTMRWRADERRKLGPSDWGTLSELDKQGVRRLYDAVPGWGRQSLGPSGGTELAPRAASHDGKLWLVWNGSGDDGIWCSTYDGAGWSPQVRVSGVGTEEVPVICSHDGALHMAWRGSGADASIWHSTYSGGRWTPQQRVPNVGASAGPALASYAGRLWMTWRGSGDDNIWCSVFDGTWSPQQRVPGVATSSRPVMAVHADRLFLAWKGTGSDTRIWTSSTVGDRWTNQQAVPQAGTSHGPALVEYDGTLWLAWKGSGDQGIWWSSARWGVGWTGQARIDGVGTADSPALANYGGRLHLHWAGIGHNGLYHAEFPLRR